MFQLRTGLTSVSYTYRHVVMCAFLCARMVMTKRSGRYCKDEPPSPEDQPSAWAENHALQLHCLAALASGLALLVTKDPGQRLSSHTRVRQSRLQLSVQQHTSHLNKWNGPRKVKCGASLNIKARITDEMEARSCFISSQPQSSSPHSLSGSLGTLPTRSINTHCRLFFVKKRLEETINTHDKCQAVACVAVPGCDVQTPSAAVQLAFFMNISRWFLHPWVKGSGFRWSSTKVKHERTADNKVSCSSNLSARWSCTGETFAAYQLAKNCFDLWFHAGQVGQKGFLKLFSPLKGVLTLVRTSVRLVSKNHAVAMSLKVWLQKMLWWCGSSTLRNPPSSLRPDVMWF